MKESEPDALKQLWQAAAQHDAEHHRLRPEQLEPLLKGRTRSALRTMQWNVLLEALLGLALMGFFLWLSFRLPELRWVCRAAAVFFSPLYILYYRNFRQLQAAESVTGHLRDQLQHTLRYWESALRLYVWMTMALLPPFFLVGGVLGAYEAGELEAVQKVIINRWYFWLPAMAALTWAMFPLVRWLVRFSYGRHLEKLKICLAELERPTEE